MSQASIGTTSRHWPARMGRKLASEYLREVYGIRLNPRTLAKMAVSGQGPAFYKDGPFVLHDRTEHLDVYAVQRLGPPRTCSRNTAA